MDRKKMPLILMLISGAITVIIALVLDYTLKQTLSLLFLVLLLFFIFGNILKYILNSFDKENKKREEAEMEELEKKAQEEAENEANKAQIELEKEDEK